MEEIDLECCKVPFNTHASLMNHDLNNWLKRLSSCPRRNQHPNLPQRLFRETFQNLSNAMLDSYPPSASAQARSASCARRQLFNPQAFSRLRGLSSNGTGSYAKAESLSGSAFQNPLFLTFLGRCVFADGNCKNYTSATKPVKLRSLSRQQHSTAPNSTAKA
jgi:hypothetical protein